MWEEKPNFRNHLWMMCHHNSVCVVKSELFLRNMRFNDILCYFADCVCHNLIVSYLNTFKVILKSYWLNGEIHLQQNYLWDPARINLKKIWRIYCFLMWYWKYSQDCRLHYITQEWYDKLHHVNKTLPRV